MLKSILASGAILLSLVCISCKTLPTELPAPAVSSDSSNASLITIQGEFRSTKGVQSSLSCYCYNSGVLRLSDGSLHDVCFDENVEIPCTFIRVTGEYITESKQVDDSNPCASGSMELFKVVSFTCVEE